MTLASRAVTLIAAIFAFVSLSAAAMAGSVNVDRNGLALQGFDPVAYFTENKPVKGDAAHAATHEGATYHFASAENRDTFAADPAKYAPQYGGYCAYGVAKGVKAGIEPEQFTVLDGKLYLNYNAGVQRTWKKDVPGYLARSEENWQHLGTN